MYIKKRTQRDLIFLGAGLGTGLLIGGIIGGYIGTKEARVAVKQAKEAAETHDVLSKKFMEKIRQLDALDEIKVPENSELVFRMKNRAKEETPEVSTEEVVEPVILREETEDEAYARRYSEKNAELEDDNWVWEEELANRGPDHPYIIHYNEFHNQESGYDQTTIYYYVEDGILCDEEQVPVYDPEKVAGRLEFGRGSRDPNICYVRNDKLQHEYEVCRELGSFQQDVLGYEAEQRFSKNDLKHSVPKFRVD